MVGIGGIPPGYTLGKWAPFRRSVSDWMRLKSDTLVTSISHLRHLRCAVDSKVQSKAERGMGRRHHRVIYILKALNAARGLTNYT